MILRLCLNEMVLQSSEHDLSFRQRQPDCPGRIFVNRRAATNLMNADDPIRPDHLHHDPPLHPAPRFLDKADRSTPTFWTVSDPIIEQIEAFRCRRGGLTAERRNRGYTLYNARSGALVARLRPTDAEGRFHVLYWSLWKERWIAGGPLGPAKLSIDRALEFIAAEDIFWTHR